jgi:hypothetical protein
MSVYTISDMAQLFSLDIYLQPARHIHPCLYNHFFGGVAGIATSYPASTTMSIPPPGAVIIPDGRASPSSSFATSVLGKRSRSERSRNYGTPTSISRLRIEAETARHLPPDVLAIVDAYAAQRLYTQQLMSWFHNVGIGNWVVPSLVPWVPTQIVTVNVDRDSIRYELVKCHKCDGWHSQSWFYYNPKSCFDEFLGRVKN